MRIDALKISNFRALTNVELTDLKDTIVIAGPNGCGKSCIFDAIRLLKSVYGGYQPNEWHQWFGEFKINVNQLATSWITLFQTPTLPLAIEITFSLSGDEIAFLRNSAEALLTEHAWAHLAPNENPMRRGVTAQAPIAANLRLQPKIQEFVQEGLGELLADLERPTHFGAVRVSPSGEVHLEPSRLLEVVFSHYDPQNLGIIDYHGATRAYTRENLGGINLNLEEASENRLKQHALYNYANKYSNLKNEMAGSYVRQLLAHQANPQLPVQSLDETLKGLFTTFFPSKTFLGVQATEQGRLAFPVRTANGSEHDIDELSSGEKEVLYGYLRLRNTAPRHSVLLIDEPELHLNPRLISGLASFYHDHLGKPLDTQLWLVTHSDTLIREAVGQGGFSVYHLQPPGQFDGSNQASPVTATAQLERVVIDLVGDLAAYRPGAKIVIFEGDSDSEFDAGMVCKLFPEFQARVNPISGGNKSRVAQLYGLLESARAAGHLPGRFYSITDSDDDPAQERVSRQFSWDVYHIENYLLVPDVIFQVLSDAEKATGDLGSVDNVLRSLTTCAESTMNSLIAHKLRAKVNQGLVSCLNLGFAPNSQALARAVSDAAERSKDRIVEALGADLSPEALARFETECRVSLQAALADGTWTKKFRGRDVLKRFVHENALGLDYEGFRSLITTKMRAVGYEPPGMRAVVQSILSD